jgi:hypothetical protein
VTLLVLDEQLSARSLVAGLRARGLDVTTVAELDLVGRADPDLVRAIDERCDGPWVLVTMDLALGDEPPDQGHAIAWIVPHEGLSGAAVERAKANILHRWAHEIVGLGRGDQRTYYETSRAKARPSLASQLARKL